jgi:hypothetical protein
MEYRKYIKKRFTIKEQASNDPNFLELIKKWFPASKNTTSQKNMSMSDSLELLSIPRKDIIDLRKTHRRFCGIYFLLENQVVVYIGKSVNVLTRLAVQCKNKDKEFSHCSYIITRPDVVEELERFLIESLKPKYNKTFNAR